MSFKIELLTNNISYQYGDETYETKEIECLDSQLHNEKGGHKEPDDTTIEAKYQAHSEHGLFVWVVRATRSGFNSYGDIDDVKSVIPENCIALVEPRFMSS